MLKHPAAAPLCAGAMALAVLLTVLLMAGVPGLERAGAEPEYARRLFDQSRVHTLDLRVEDWEGFLSRALEEEYVPADISVDGEEFRRVGLRTKGNNSLHLTARYGLPRFGLKVEMDHYGGSSYHGLDKFSLDPSFQDNSYLKSWLAYDMMAFMEVPAPLCSYVWVTVNGEPWGLFLAIEEPEEAFARRVYGRDHGQLYKPDYLSLEEENRDLALQYLGEDPEDYGNLFREAKFPVSGADQRRLIGALRALSAGEELETAVEVDEVLRYFAVQVFVMNWDSYLGPTGHNYFLYEKDGRISILPWDYNLAFGTYALGMPDPIRDPNILINWPVDTPAWGEVMLQRPLYHKLMEKEEYFLRYRGYLEELISGYFESGLFEVRLTAMARSIAPYVRRDPTAFCTYGDHLLGAETLEEVCRLRAESIRGQLEGRYPSSLAGFSGGSPGVDASHVRLEDLGDFDDLDRASARLGVG